MDYDNVVIYIYKQELHGINGLFRLKIAIIVSEILKIDYMFTK